MITKYVCYIFSKNITFLCDETFDFIQLHSLQEPQQPQMKESKISQTTVPPEVTADEEESKPVKETTDEKEPEDYYTYSGYYNYN